MKRPALLLAALVLAGTVSAPAQSTEDQYVRIYNLIQQADGLSNSGRKEQALPKYLEAQSALQRIKQFNPTWNPKVVNFRLEYLADKITELPTAQPVVAPPAPKASLPVPTPAPTARETRSTPTVNSDSADVMALQNDLRRLQSDNAILEAKLKEALATQPAAADPREFVKAQERIQSLLKENELLKTNLETERTRTAPALASAKELDELKQAVAAANRQVADQTALARSLTAERESLKQQLAALTKNPAANEELAATKLALTEANRRLAEQTATAARLTTEKAALTERVNQFVANANAGEALRAENELLKQQLASSRTNTLSGDAAAQRLAQAEARIATLQSDAQVLRLEKTALESRLKRGGGTAPQTAATRDADAARIRELVQDRDNLQQKLELVTKSTGNQPAKELVAKVDSLTREVSGLRAKVEVFEARAIPYTSEELALFKPVKPAAPSIDPTAGRRSIRELPSGSAELIAQAQRKFANKEFDKAEADYLQVLQLDATNQNTLANLATIQMELGKLDEAEKNIKQALVVAPDDGYNLSILGYVKFRQEKYDEALEALSRAAQLLPKSAEVQNFLGVTLSHKGQRGPAETALRKAIQIDPGYGNAHNNLAIIYAAQTPPLIELARWHYQKALAAGLPKNAELEQLFAKRETAPK